MPKSLAKILVLSASLWFVACSDSSSNVVTTNVEVVILQGDGQFAPAGQRLSEPLAVVVRRADSHRPVADGVVEFSVVEGQGAQLDDSAVVTDAEGIASTGLRLGSQTSTYRVRVTLVDSAADPVEFEAFAVLPPALGSVPDVVVAGEVAEISGQNFNPVAQSNVVLFAGIRGQVVSAAPTRMSVRVPACLLSRRATVTVRFGTVASNQLETLVQGTAQRLELELGEDTLLAQSDGSACVTLPGSAETRYLLTLQSAGRVAGARHRIALRGRARSVATASAARVPRIALDEVDSTVGSPSEVSIEASSDWHTFLRHTEDGLVRNRRASQNAVVRVPAPSGVPTVGHSRDFSVLGRDAQSVNVQATARVVGERAALYVDDRASALISDAALAELSNAFDDPIHGAVTSGFGAASDLDVNERVIILFTPEVNRLTDRGEDGFVAGFFFGLDLLIENEGSNQGEIFYVLVPDPNGTYSDPRSLQSLLSALPPVLAHEFQHMVHFNQRVLLQEGGGTDALWLSEGLATMAEDLVSQSEGLSGAARRGFISGNRVRAGRFVIDPEDLSLTVTSGSGSLAERGAGWLFVRYLWEHFGADNLLRGLIRSTETGIDNVEGVTGESWERLFSDWGVAVQNEFEPWNQRQDRHTYPELALRSLLDDGGNGITAELPVALGAVDFDQVAELWSGGTAYFVLNVAGGQPISLNIGAENGGPLSPTSLTQLRIVRVR